MNKKDSIVASAGFLLVLSSQAAAEEAGIAGRLQVSVPVGVADVGYRRWGLEGSSSQFRARLGGANLFSRGVLGYALTEHWVLGMEAGYSASSVEGQPTDKDWLLGPRVTYVFEPGKPVRPFVSVSAEASADSWGRFQSDSVSGGINAGMIIRIVEGLSVDPGMGLRYSYFHRVYSFSEELQEDNEHSLDLAASVAFTAWL